MKEKQAVPYQMKKKHRNKNNRPQYTTENAQGLSTFISQKAYISYGLKERRIYDIC